jgi:hypothetical protein
VAFQSPIFTGSTYRHARAIQFDDGRIIFRLPERIPFEDRDDSILHISNGRERLWDLAQLYYGSEVRDAIDLWEVIAQFQPEPIQDPSIPLQAGLSVLIPSLEYIEDVAFGDSLSDVPEI